MNLHREDFSLGPISYDEIEPNLYLGSLSAAKDIETLNKRKITHILTIDICPLPRSILELQHITTKFVQLSDLPHEDLLSHLDDTYLFIEEGLRKSAVFVHCYFGVSRSASIVLGYIMKKYGLSYSQAFERVEAKRSLVSPNSGFKAQLKLYREMGYTIDRSNMKYKKYRLAMAADRVKKVKILPQNFMDVIQPDPGIPQSQPHPNVYRCRKCRRVLATEGNLIPHKEDKSLCTKAHFVEPMVWMNVTQTLQGKLHCPKCQNKVGAFSWTMACQCPCTAQVSPAFYLVASKIDYTNVVKNVELTF